METIRVSPGTPGRLVVRFPYSPEAVMRIKSIWGRHWHVEEKFWTVPDKPGMLERLKEVFAPDLVETESLGRFPPPPLPSSRSFAMPSGQSITARGPKTPTTPGSYAFSPRLRERPLSPWVRLKSVDS